MAFQLAAFLAGIGGITKGIGAITNNRDLMKIGEASSLAGASLKNMDSMLKPAENKSGLGILGSLTDPESELGGMTDRLLGPAVKSLTKGSPLSDITNAHIGLPKDTTSGLTSWLDSNISDNFLRSR